MTKPPMLERRLALDPQVALRPEPFGALAYHYGNRKLIFLKHPDIVRVVQALGDHDTLADTLRACEIDPTRWTSFESALSALTRSEMLHELEPVTAG
ncbi:MAG TPA: mycofactocin biosynthesis chaperone MftB [Ilumatobacteraceae bacterium]|nr:mycofactocin biosynthesis chaperone MftB [Ilumatobacteraceae bacterium]